MGVVEPGDGGSIIAVRVVPGASRPGVVGLHGDEVRVRVASPPEGGRANTELCALVARVLGIRPSTVSVVAGATARSKRLVVPVAVDAVREAFGIGRTGPADR
ncbi:MAG: DUF167 domain-containing protein [Ilumatobacteraceae bacterium]